MSDIDSFVPDIPESAKRRLAEMRGVDQAAPRLFTSDLSVNEFLMVEQAGFEPVGFVMGSSFFHIGIQWTIMPFQNYELDVLTAALYHAREYALKRMEEEAHLIDADGVVGVRLELGQQAWAAGMVEFTALGTAIRARDRSRDYRKANGRPFTSDLSGQDFWTLLQTGCRPLELTLGNCVYHVARRGFRQALGQWGKNVEMPNYTQAIYTARELALERMQADAERVHAHGIVGVNVTQRNHGWNAHVLEFVAIGTAVLRYGPPTLTQPPQIVLNVSETHSPVIPTMPDPKTPASPPASGGGE
jgi:uncharacterized protein YbjQ (UPF0145 family)